MERIRELILQKRMGDGYDRADLAAFALGDPSDLEHRLLAILREVPS